MRRRVKGKKCDQKKKKLDLFFSFSFVSSSPPLSSNDHCILLSVYVFIITYKPEERVNKYTIDSRTFSLVLYRPVEAAVAKLPHDRRVAAVELLDGALPCYDALVQEHEPVHGAADRRVLVRDDDVGRTDRGRVVVVVFVVGVVGVVVVEKRPTDATAALRVLVLSLPLWAEAADKVLDDR